MVLQDKGNAENRGNGGDGDDNRRKSGRLSPADMMRGIGGAVMRVSRGMGGTLRKWCSGVNGAIAKRCRTVADALNPKTASGLLSLIHI